MKSVMKICTRAILLQEGRMLADGPPAEVFDRYGETLHLHADKEEPASIAKTATHKKVTV
jgi:ABC-type multidrug transport system ATPase subunit